jgi:hypothetical protein
VSQKRPLFLVDDPELEASEGVGIGGFHFAVLKYHLHGYASLSFANNNIGNETSYRSSK